jgi:hypothetical protein
MSDETRCPKCGGPTRRCGYLYRDGTRCHRPVCFRADLHHDCPGERRKGERRKGQLAQREEG